jgi:transposase
MIDVGGKKIYLACGVTDMRNGINGLVGIVENTFRLDPCGEAIFAFCNRPRNLIKILEWDGDGFWLHTKKLAKGHFTWPTDVGDGAMSLHEDELRILLGATRLDSKLKRRDMFVPNAA